MRDGYAEEIFTVGKGRSA